MFSRIKFRNLFQGDSSKVIIKNNYKASPISEMKLVFDSKLKGATVLDKNLFKQTIEVPALKIKRNDFAKYRKILKDFQLECFLNMRKFQEINSDEKLNLTHKYMLLDPELYKPESLDQKLMLEFVALLNESGSESKAEDLDKYIENVQIDIAYEDLKFDEVMKAIIPDSLQSENVNVKGYSVIGHIAHFNLRDKVLDYKHIIGEVLLDKVNTVKTVVNKLNEIDNTYRNFSFEILAGEKNTVVTCKENGCEFKFDFANVYWNPRLGTEHERVVKLLTHKDVLYDVFAGVGPFSIPAVSCRKLNAVLANDLNPNSYKYLLENNNHNNKSKVKKRDLDFRKALVKNTTIPERLFSKEGAFRFNPNDFFTAFNLDGREFIRNKVKFHLVDVLNYRKANKIDIESESELGKFYVLMNLPALSIEFLDSFTSLYTSEEEAVIRNTFSEEFLKNFRLNIFCYHFSRAEEGEYDKLKDRIRKDIFRDENLTFDSKYVRKVAPSKDMYCSMFKIGFDHMFTRVVDEADGSNKKKLDEVYAGDQAEGDNQTKIAKVD